VPAPSAPSTTDRPSRRTALQRADERPTDEVNDAIRIHALLAAMDIADASSATSVAPLLQEPESSTERATSLHARWRRLSSS